MLNSLLSENDQVIGIVVSETILKILLHSCPRSLIQPELEVLQIECTKEAASFHNPHLHHTTFSDPLALSSSLEDHHHPSAHRNPEVLVQLIWTRSVNEMGALKVHITLDSLTILALSTAVMKLGSFANALGSAMVNFIRAT